MHGLGLRTSAWLTTLVLMACSPVKPTATEYKEKLSAGGTTGTKPTTTTGKPAPSTGAPASPGAAAPASGNAQNGLAILTTTCETAGCHKDSAPQLIKGTTITDATVSKAAHRGVQPVFTKENINDMNAALANR